MAHVKSVVLFDLLVSIKTSSVPSKSKLLIKWDKTVTKVVQLHNIPLVTALHACVN